MDEDRRNLLLSIYRQKFAAFGRAAFEILNPESEFVDGMAFRLIADRLESVVRGEIKRLIINLPPRSLKSHLASICLPLWLAGRQPASTIMTISGSGDLAGDFEDATLRLLDSPLIQAIFPGMDPTWGRRALRFANGSERIRGVYGGKILGRGADLIVVDDPQPANLTLSGSGWEKSHLWFDSQVVQRLNDPEEGAVVVIMQRLHPNDLVAHLSKSDDWELVNLPAIALQPERYFLRDGRTIERMQGEALDPVRMPINALKETMEQIGAVQFATQYLQQPGRVKDEWRGGWFARDEIDDATGKIRLDVPGLRDIRETDILNYEVFGAPGLHPARVAKRLTLQEWFEMERRYDNDLEAFLRARRQKNKIAGFAC